MNWAAFLTTLTGLFMIIAWYQVIRAPLDRLGQELGWTLARNQLDRLDRDEALAKLQLDAAGWRREFWLQVPNGWEPSGPARHTGRVRVVPAPWLCPACQHGNHGCQPGRCRCPGARLA